MAGTLFHPRALLFLVVIQVSRPVFSGDLAQMKSSAHRDAVTDTTSTPVPTVEAESTKERNPHTASLIFGFFFHLPHYLIEDRREYTYEAQFLSFPYEGGVKGYMSAPIYHQETAFPPTTESGDLLIGEEDDRVVPAYRTRPFALRMAVDYSFNLDAVHRTSLYFMLDTRWRLGIEGGVTSVRDNTTDVDAPARAGLGDVNAVFRFAQSKRIQMRTGVGGRFMVDEAGSSAGVNFTYGIDAYPRRPVVISAIVDFGSLGSAFVFHGRGHVGAVFRSLELFAGWDLLQVSDTTVHGPLVGIRAWI